MAGAGVWMQVVGAVQVPPWVQTLVEALQPVWMVVVQAKVQVLLSEWTGARADAYSDEPATNLAEMGLNPPARRIMLARNRPVARSYSRRQASPSSVTAAMVHSRPSSMGMMIMGSKTAQEASRSHNSRRKAGPILPETESAPMATAARATTAMVAITIPTVTGWANA